MISSELRDALIGLQATVLERIAARQGVAASRAQLAKSIEQRGIRGAFVEMGRQPARQPAPRRSFFRRFIGRWFG